MHALRLQRNWLVLLLAAIAVVSLSGLSSTVFADEEPHGSHEVPAGEHGEGDHGGDAHDTSVPMKPKTDLVIFTIITFVLFLVVLKFVAWGPLIEGLDKRESKYLKLLADAQHDRDKAVKLLSDYDAKLKAAQKQVDEIIAEARRDADRTKADIVAAANAEAEATRKRALDDIGRARDQAVASLFDHIRANVVAATEKVLARSLSDADHQRLVDEALAGISSSSN